MSWTMSSWVITKEIIQRQLDLTRKMTINGFDNPANTFISFINNVLIYRLTLWYTAMTEPQRLLALGLQQ